MPETLDWLFSVLLWLLPVAVWCAWWLWAVSWRRVWPVLAEGAWVPVVLLMVLGALVWSQVAPRPCDCLVLVRLPNFWWQLGGVAALAAAALFCGWLQGKLDWGPPEVSYEPAAPAEGHHGHH
jgi:hypothetical protein